MRTQRTVSAPYRKIFASYSHKDTGIAEYVEYHMGLLGDTYWRDVHVLRSGEVWQDALKRLIEQADIFQLFWSHNAMHSEHVTAEWKHALTLERPEFIRPIYWEEPLPRIQERDLPPEALLRLEFRYLDLDRPRPLGSIGSDRAFARVKPPMGAPAERERRAHPLSAPRFASRAAHVGLGLHIAGL
jgi:hypothetical protein